jgi:hypothetical protein
MDVGQMLIMLASNVTANNYNAHELHSDGKCDPSTMADVALQCVKGFFLFFYLTPITSRVFKVPPMSLREKKRKKEL